MEGCLVELAGTQDQLYTVKEELLRNRREADKLRESLHLSDQGVRQHVALVFEADGSARAYLNGEQGSTIRSSFDFKGVQAGLAAPFLGQYGTPFVGALDDFCITNRALTAKEIKDIK